MFSGRKSAEKRREQIEMAEQAVVDAMSELASDDVAEARRTIGGAPKTHFADAGWKVALVGAMVDLKAGRVSKSISKLVAVCSRLDETSLSKDDKNYLRLYALYRSSEVTKDRRAPAELRDLVEDFRFDHTMVNPELRRTFPLKDDFEEAEAETPPPPPPPSAG